MIRIVAWHGNESGCSKTNQMSTFVLNGQHQFIEREELPYDRILTLVHLLHCAKKTGFSLMEEDDTIRKFSCEPHVMGYYDAG